MKKKNIAVTNYHLCDHCQETTDATTYHDVELANGERVTLCNACLHEEAERQPSDNLRRFETGAIRDTEQGKVDPEGFLHPLVIKAFCDYMHKHRTLPGGSLRDSDNWQKGFPRDVLMKSAWRHFLDLWMEHRGFQSREGIDDALAGLMFNIQAYWLEVVKERLNGSCVKR